MFPTFYFYRLQKYSWLFRNMLLNIGTFSDISLLLISNSVPLWSKSGFYHFTPLIHLVYAHIRSSLRDGPYSLGKNMGPLLSGGVSCKRCLGCVGWWCCSRLSFPHSFLSTCAVDYWERSTEISNFVFLLGFCFI